MTFNILPRWAAETVTNAITNLSIDRTFDYTIWHLFKRKIDESEAGVLYRGPGPRSRPIHRLRVVDPSLGDIYWLTVPNFCGKAQEALLWTWGYRAFDVEITEHV
jgi:hypothetical protein